MELHSDTCTLLNSRENGTTFRHFVHFLIIIIFSNVTTLVKQVQ